MEIEARAFVVRRRVNPESLKRKISSGHPRALVQSAKRDAATNAFFLEMIAAQTLRAGATGILLAKKPEIDFLLRLAGTTQISKAIVDVGARKGRPFLLIVAGPGHGLGSLDGSAFEGRELPKRKLSRKELSMVERAALLNVLKA